ncbi:iron complex transport system ATP-binding protein [Brevibacterium sp. Mu109]|uniref:ABC transporter ATP-binding protein n=1 Tax=Brevibacterium sp. Mu109 TaxID=1255669 RepID=UPI000C67DEFB|nr:ATP-binding cassette domain-containing protein [Brevibacterium sp. Mu109]SMX79660.1 iron complex transport system ATP-binding protein [Brevibacterium sp. Mu109]
MTDPRATALAFADVTVRRASTVILPGISFAVGRGEHWVMLGPNGAGKSTILSLAGGTAHPTSGTVDVLGHRLGRVELRALRERIGHVNPRHPLRSKLTTLDVVLTGLTGTVETMLRWTPTPEQQERAHHLLSIFGLADRVSATWPTLSQGERGRALLARALLTEPELLLLDEPATGLDVAAREQLLETLDVLPVTHPDLTTLLVTHHLEEIPSSVTHALLLRDGALLDHGPADRVLTTDNVTATFDHPIAVHREDGRWGARSDRRRSAPHPARLSPAGAGHA